MLCEMTVGSNADPDTESDAESDAESENETDAESEDETDAESEDEYYDDDDPFSLAFSPTGSQLAVGDKKATVSVYDTCTKELLASTTVEGERVSALAYSPNGQELGSRDIVRSIAWNPVVPLEFVTGCQDRSVRVWRISESSDGCGAVSVDLMWASNIGMLSASGMTLDGVIGLDVDSRKILKQRGAVGDVLTIEGDGAGDSPNDDGDSGDEEGPKGGPSSGSMLEKEKEEKDEEEYESEKRA
ncbi:hypothetical protein BGZ97_012604 [Linnemannia gamsii]|uniref:WD40 repeat-like protein n=1 Tax=Linnemannia gamsii TaxID=64522 RepID=A0A9P6R191_9FUNG|nr:hypothetical protein BGZ97_012604 [Linnemannia gamsii]